MRLLRQNECVYKAYAQIELTEMHVRVHSIFQENTAHRISIAECEVYGDDEVEPQAAADKVQEGRVLEL